MDSTLGAAFLGGIAAAVLYGITTVQTVIYYRTCYKDRLILKILVSFLWFLDTVHLAFVTHGLYFYLITNYSNPLSVVSPAWSILAQIYLTCISDLIVRSIFGRRVWSMSGHNMLLTLAIGITSLYVFASGFAFSSLAFAIGTFTGLSEISWLLYSGFATGVVADGLIAAALCVLLRRSRTGFRRTDSLVATLMAYAINTGLLTSVCTAAVFVTYAVFPTKLIFMGIYFALSKMYVNALLATLNAREGIRAQALGVSSISPTTVDRIAMTSLPASEAEDTTKARSAFGSSEQLSISICTKYETFR